MKFGQREWTAFTIIVGLLLLLWIGGGFREDMTGVQTLTGNETVDKPYIDSVINKLESIATSLGYDKGYALDAGKLVQIYSPIYTSATSVPSKDTFVSQISNGKTSTYDKLSSEEKIQVDITYQYFYGNSTATTPVPATSSSTQPMNVGVPTPCRPSYKSIPGGSLEFKCFS